MLMVHPRLSYPNEQNELISKWTKWTNEQMNKHFYSFKKMSKHFYYKMSKMSKWAKFPYEQIWCQMSTWSSNLLQKYPRVYHAHGTPGCTMSELILVSYHTIVSHKNHHKVRWVIIYFMWTNEAGEKVVLDNIMIHWHHSKNIPAFSDI